VGSRPPAQQRFLTARPDRCEIPRLQARRAVPHAIDAAMLTEQRAYLQSLLDLGITDARA
jgi:hypothetical protein